MLEYEDFLVYINVSGLGPDYIEIITKTVAESTNKNKIIVQIDKQPYMYLLIFLYIKKVIPAKLWTATLAHNRQFEERTNE